MHKVATSSNLTLGTACITKLPQAVEIWSVPANPYLITFAVRCVPMSVSVQSLPCALVD